MRRTTLSISVLPLLALAVSGLAAPPVEAAPPQNPFVDVAESLRYGPSVRTRGAILLALKLPPDAQPGLMAHVGLATTDNRISSLPGPAGRWHVRISNQEKFPLLIPAGEALLTPLRGSRSVDRPVWIPAGGASFVPVVQGVTPPPPGPYLSRGRGLTPMELSQIPVDRWADRVRRRNQVFGVTGGARRDDAAEAYTSHLFETVLERYQKDLDALVAPHSVVGVAVCDDRGVHYAHLQCDRGRFAALWPSLRDGIVLDALLLERTGGAPRPGDDASLRATVRDLVRALVTTPLRRPTFGEGWQYRWDLADPPAYWEGLAIPAGPVSLTLHRDAPRPAGTRPTTGPTGPIGGPAENQETPGIFEGERKARPSEFEKRLRDRRREGLGRGTGRTPGSTPGSTPPRGGGGGATPRSPSTPAPPRWDPPGGGGGGIGPRGR